MLISFRQFGKVYATDYRNNDGAVVQVAVKLVKVSASQAEKEEFLSEVELMIHFDHPNILKVQWLISLLDRAYVIAGYWRMCVPQALAVGCGDDGLSRLGVRPSRLQKGQH